MQTIKRCGSDRVRKEYTQEHCKLLEQWFDKQGRSDLFPTTGDLRARLFPCYSLFRHDKSKYHRLANAIVETTPVGSNHFVPIAAIELLLLFNEKLTVPARKRLETMVSEQYLNMVDIRFGGGGLQNFTAMTTFFLLGAAQHMDGYSFDHPKASIPEVYCQGRMWSIGLNALRALAHYSEHHSVAEEWNSPTYSPLSIHSMAKIVELIDHDEARALAMEIEGRLWREILSMYHPGLDLSCGPYSRAYRRDIVGDCTALRRLLTFVGVSRIRSMLQYQFEQEGTVNYHSPGNLPDRWAGPAWQMATKYHIPRDLLDGLRSRSICFSFDAPIEQPAKMILDQKAKKVVSVQGDLFPALSTEIHQEQGQGFCLGWVGETNRLGHSFPVHFHYALRKRVRSIGDVRSITGAVLLEGEPEEWITDSLGYRCESSNFNHAGAIKVKRTKRGLSFQGHPLVELAPLPCESITLNTFISEHYAPVNAISLNGILYEEAPISITGTKANVQIDDAGFSYAIHYQVDSPVEFRLQRWANFLRFSAVLHEGKSTILSPANRRKMTFYGKLVLS